MNILQKDGFAEFIEQKLRNKSDPPWHTDEVETIFFQETSYKSTNNQLYVHTINFLSEKGLLRFDKTYDF